MIWLMIIAVILLDQISKYIIRAGFEVGETLPVIRDVFHITYVQNRGAAFSMFQNMHLLTIAFPCVAVAVCLVAMVYFRKHGDKISAFALALIAAGGIGNLIDRIGMGFVTDMFDFRVFPVFNVADIGVTCGCALLVLCIVFEGKISKK